MPSLYHTIAANALVIQGAQASAAVIVTHFSQNIPLSAPEGLTQWGLNKMAKISQTFPFWWQKNFVSRMSDSTFSEVYPRETNWCYIGSGNGLTPQVAGHYLSQWWHISVMHICTIRPQWINPSVTFVIIGQSHNLSHQWHQAITQGKIVDWTQEINFKHQSIKKNHDPINSNPKCYNNKSDNIYSGHIELSQWIQLQNFPSWWHGCRWSFNTCQTFINKGELS